MELFNEFQLFSFLPVLAIGGFFWYERMRRQNAQKRTRYLFLSLVALTLIALIQTSAWVLRTVLSPLAPQVFVVSGLLYFLALFFLEYAIHVNRIEQSFLAKEFWKEVRWVGFWFGLAALLATAVLISGPNQMRLLVTAYSVSLAAGSVTVAHKVFSLREGVIRRRRYPFYSLVVAITIVWLFILFGSPKPVSSAGALPLGWFCLLNIVFVVRLLEEFLFWAQYNLRSDRNKFEERQHLQNVLIRHILGATGHEDRVVVREILEAALEMVKSRQVVEKYQITGMAAYRVVGTQVHIEHANHILGHGPAVFDQILNSTYNLNELSGPTTGKLGDFGTKLISEALLKKRPVVTSDLPEAWKGLLRLIVVVPVSDDEKLVGVLIVFKDSFDQLYPGEKDVLAELAENLATVYALMAGKEFQRDGIRQPSGMSATLHSRL